MGIDILTLAMARKHVESTANALGAVKGAPCTIQAIEETAEGNVVTFGWTGTDGTQQTSRITVKHGVGNAQLEEAFRKMEEQIAAVEDAVERADAAAERAEAASGESEGAAVTF